MTSLFEAMELLKQHYLQKVQDIVNEQNELKKDVYYYEPCHGERPGEVDIEAKKEGIRLAAEFGLKCQSKEDGGYYMYGEESKLRELLSRWYEEEEIDKILNQGTTDYKDQ